jgi:hypothetical protein
VFLATLKDAVKKIDKKQKTEEDDPNAPVLEGDYVEEMSQALPNRFILEDELAPHLRTLPESDQVKMKEWISKGSIDHLTTKDVSILCIT